MRCWLPLSLSRSSRTTCGRKYGRPAATGAPSKARGEVETAALAGQWQRFYESRLVDFTDVYRQDLPGAFRQFQEEGQIEIMVSAATHAYLPLLGLDSSIDAQIGQGVATYRKHFLREPAGMWLPECAYRPESIPPGGCARRGLEAFLAAHHLKYFFVDGRHLRHQPDNPGSYAAWVDRGLGVEGAGGGPATYRDRPGSRGTLPQAAAEVCRGLTSAEDYVDIYAIHQTGRPGSEVAVLCPRHGDEPAGVERGARLPRRPLLPGIP